MLVRQYAKTLGHVRVAYLRDSEAVILVSGGGLFHLRHHHTSVVSQMAL